jgi:hypothetical protein
MLVSWDQEFIADKNKIFKYGTIKLVVRFQKLDSGMFYFIDYKILKKYSIFSAATLTEKLKHSSKYNGGSNIDCITGLQCTALIAENLTISVT